MQATGSWTIAQGRDTNPERHPTDESEKTRRLTPESPEAEG